MSDSDTSEQSAETVTIQIWDRPRNTSFKSMSPDDPDKELELPLPNGSNFWEPNPNHVLSDDIQNHRKYAFHVKDAEALPESVKVNVFSNDSPHTPSEWGRPIEGGIQFPSNTEEPFKTEIWGRIKVEVESV